MYSCHPLLFSVTVLRYPNKYNVTPVTDVTAEISYEDTWFHLEHCLGLSERQLPPCEDTQEAYREPHMVRNQGLPAVT